MDDAMTQRSQRDRRVTAAGQVMKRRKARYRPPTSYARVATRKTLDPKAGANQGLDIERLARLIAGAAIFLYVLGLLAINGYLFRLGISDFTLVRTRFIYTGALIAACAALIYVFPVGLLGTLMEEHEKLRYWRRHERIEALRELSLEDWVMIPIALGLPIFAIAFGLSLASRQTMGRALVAAATISLAALLPGLVIVYVITLPRSSWRKVSQQRRLAGAMIAGFLCFFVWLFYVSAFMNIVYPQLPEQFGGGRPRTVQILLKQDNVEGGREIGLSIPKDRYLSDPVQLVYESDKTYVLRMKSDKLVQLNKELTAGVILTP